MNIQGQIQIWVNNFLHNMTLLETYARTHHSFLFEIALLFTLLFLLRISKHKQKNETVTNQHEMNTTEMSEIAGENPIATQLDLARAYIEMDKKQLAKNILLKISKNGSTMQKQQARQLIETL